MFAYGVLLTLLYFFILGITILGLDLEPVSSWNELGDFLAGAFSPVAFLWLVLGYMQQQKELKQNTQALMLQAEELKGSVEQASNMVELTRDQLDFEKIKHSMEVNKYVAEQRPCMELSLGGISTQKLNEKVTNVVLKNTAKTASNIFLEFNDVEMRSPALPINSLSLGEKRVFNIPFPTTNLPRSDFIKIKCRDVLGNECIFEFYVSVDVNKEIKIMAKT